jgi:GDP-L-fucose synthase
MNKSSKIYVAGHLGLVGSALWKNLLSKGYTNLVGRTISELNLLDPQAVNIFFEEEKPEYVILAAAKVGGIVANNIYRGQFIYENLVIQANVIHASYLNNVKKLLFLGSTCIYPRDSPQPMKEECLLNGPLEYTNEPYAIAKIAGIKLCESYNLQYGTNFISVMPTNLYGPNDNFNLETSHVLPALIRKIHLGKCLAENNWKEIRIDLDNRPNEGVNGKSSEVEILDKLGKYGITTQTVPNSGEIDPESVKVDIWGTGTPFREFLWSEEMADACIFLMENIDFADVLSFNHATVEQSGSKEIRNTHINIGTGEEISIRDLAYLIKEAIGFTGEIVFNSSKPDGTLRKLTDPTKLHKLGWHHKIKIEEGINKLYRWYLGGG